MNVVIPTEVPLADWAVVTISDTDARTFLQGQITCDMQRLTPHRGLLGAWCDPQGRVLFTFYLLQRHDDEFLLALPAERAAAIAKRFTLYLLRAAVRVDTGSRWSVVGRVEAPNAQSQPRHHVVHDADSLRINLDDGRRWLELRTASSTSTASSAELEAWRLGDVLDALPIVREPLAGKFLPQMLNLDLLGELSFDKGCFQGQEIIARVRYRGRVKQRLALFEAETASTPLPGNSLYRADSGEDSSSSPGTVFDARPLAANRQAILAVATIDRDVPLCLCQNGPLLVRRSLPYDEGTTTKGSSP